MYKMILSDLDETLLVNHHVPLVNQKAIQYARNHGVKFVPATGRAFNMISEILKEIIDDYNMDFLKGQKIAKILFERRDMDYLKKIEKEIHPILKGKVNASFSSNRYLELNAVGIDKGYGLRWLARYLNISSEEVIAIGDNYNDVEMIEEAGLGVCVQCATADIQALSDYVTTANYDQGAVKEVIDKFIKEDV